MSLWVYLNTVCEREREIVGAPGLGMKALSWGGVQV